METVPAPLLLKFMWTRPVFRMRAEKAPVFLSVERLPVSASSMNHEPVPSVTLAAAYAVLPPASKPSLSGAIVAVVREIVRTISAAENAISVLTPTPNFDFFIDLSLRVKWLVSGHTWRWFAGEQRFDNLVSRSK